MRRVRDETTDAVRPERPGALRGAKLGLALTVAAAALAVGIHAWRAEAPLAFRVPDGWLDLSAGAPESRLVGLPEPIVEQARSGRFAALAVEPAPAAGRLAATFIAIVQPHPLRVDDGAAGRLASGLLHVTRWAGADAHVQRTDVVQVGGIDALRVEARVALGSREARQVVYAIPAGDRTAILAYACEPSSCSRLLPTFDASARATKGASAPRSPGGTRPDVQKAIALMLGVLAVTILRIGTGRAR